MRFFPVKIMRLTLLGLILCFATVACGTKGPLYIPEKQYPQDVEKKSTPK